MYAVTKADIQAQKDCIAACTLCPSVCTAHLPVRAFRQIKSCQLQLFSKLPIFSFTNIYCYTVLVLLPEQNC